MVVRVLTVAKIMTDAAIEAKLGHAMDVKAFREVVTQDTDCYHIDPQGNRHILFKFRKSAIPLSLRQVAQDSFEQHAKNRLTSNRGYASGLLPGQKKVKEMRNGVSAGIKVFSNIAGFMDRPTLTMRVRKTFPGLKVVCRTTAFTKDRPDLWRNGLPFLQCIDALYKRLAPKQHRAQAAAIGGVPKPLTIPGTVFSTITCNHNFRTTVHTDKGDFSRGLGNLTVVGNDLWSGGFVGFPQFGVCVDVRPGDFLLMDTSIHHCNTPLVIQEGGVRLSFVCYLREQMGLCKDRKVVDGEVYYVE